MRRRPLAKAMIDEMTTLYQSGFSLAEVGGQLGFNASTVQRHLRVRGHPLRDSHGRERLNLDFERCSKACLPPPHSQLAP